METLHQSLHTRLQATLVPTLKDYCNVLVNTFFKNRKHNEMLLETDYVPSSCRKKLPLNVLPEVVESEGFITLDAQKELMAYVMSAPDFNRLSTSKLTQKAFCLAMYKGACGFIAQIGIVGYGADQAVMDVLALYTDDLTSPFSPQMVF